MRCQPRRFQLMILRVHGILRLGSSTVRECALAQTLLCCQAATSRHRYPYPARGRGRLSGDEFAADGVLLRLALRHPVVDARSLVGDRWCRGELPSPARLRRSILLCRSRRARLAPQSRTTPLSAGARRWRLAASSSLAARAPRSGISVDLGTPSPFASASLARVCAWRRRPRSRSPCRAAFPRAARRPGPRAFSAGPRRRGRRREPLQRDFAGAQRGEGGARRLLGVDPSLFPRRRRSRAVGRRDLPALDGQPGASAAQPSTPAASPRAASHRGVSDSSSAPA